VSGTTVVIADALNQINERTETNKVARAHCYING